MKPKSWIRRRKIASPLIAGLISVVALFTTTFAHAQSKWSVEIRPSLNFPLTNVAGADINTGFGIEGTALYRVLPHTSVYAGWGWSLYPQENRNADEVSNEETGYTFGIQFLHPIAASNTKYFVKGGGIYNHLEVEEGNHVTSNSGHKLGWQLETGLSFRISDLYSINPGVRYRELSGNINRNGTRTPFHLHTIALSVGVMKNFR
jgi:opacity protein-like surface antigen